MCCFGSFFLHIWFRFRLTKCLAFSKVAPMRCTQQPTQEPSMSHLLEALRTRQPVTIQPAWTHTLNGGTHRTTLDTLPVVVHYELTNDLCGSEIAEVTEVDICGHTICAQDFAAGIRAAWGAECMQARGGL